LVLSCGVQQPSGVVFSTEGRFVLPSAPKRWRLDSAWTPAKRNVATSRCSQGLRVTTGILDLLETVAEDPCTSTVPELFFLCCGCSWCSTRTRTLLYCTSTIRGSHYNPHERANSRHNVLRRYFYATLMLGSPPRSFAVIVDTGSTITYVPCATCGQNCGPHHKVGCWCIRPSIQASLTLTLGYQSQIFWQTHHAAAHCLPPFSLCGCNRTNVKAQFWDGPLPKKPNTVHNGATALGPAMPLASSTTPPKRASLGCTVSA
jgi:hypothetical protein